MIDEFGLDFEVGKHILYLLRNAEKDQVLVFSEMVLNDTVPNQYHNTIIVPLHLSPQLLLRCLKLRSHSYMYSIPHTCVRLYPDSTVLNLVPQLSK